MQNGVDEIHVIGRGGVSTGKLYGSASRGRKDNICVRLRPLSTSESYKSGADVKLIKFS